MCARRLLLSCLLLLSIAPPLPAQVAPPLRLQRVEVRDPQMNNQVAFTLLAPTGWEVDAEVQWRHEQPNLATAYLRVSSPDQRVQVESFPIVPCTWTDGGIMGFPEGSNYLGNLVHPPVTDAAQYVGVALLPFYRQDVELELMRREPLPAVAQAVSQQVAEPGVQKQVIAERLRAGYVYEGQGYEEDFYVALVFATSQMLPGTVFWQAQHQYAFSAPAGELDSYAPLLRPRNETNATFAA